MVMPILHFLVSAFSPTFPSPPPRRRQDLPWDGIFGTMARRGGCHTPEEDPMKSVQCPVCHHSIYSETFVEGETFPCPHCEFQLVVEAYDQNPKVHTPEDLFQSLNWAHGIWKNGRLFLTQQKMGVLGELLVRAMGLTDWSKKTSDQLRQRLDAIEKAQDLLRREQIDLPVMQIERLLLDLYLNIRRQDGEGTEPAKK
jgi:hypothetical protein